MDASKQSSALDDLFERGVSTFIDPDGEFEQKIRDKVRGEYHGDIVIKFGADPTRPDIHLGHAVELRKLRQFQELGCKVVFLVGDFTSTIGDPTGKSKVRPEIDQKEIEKNMRSYVEQVSKILLTDAAHFSWIRNSDWFHDVSDIFIQKPVTITVKNEKEGSKQSVAFPANSFLAKASVFDASRMQRTHLRRNEIIDVTLRGLLWTLRNVTHAQLIERDMFQDRIKGGSELFMHEMLYPVLQGIDSFIIHQLYGSCDLEMGGTDQTFNMLMGRNVMKINKQKPQAVMSMDLLQGTDGNDKMSKSLDNYIAITDTHTDMFGKIMSVPDNLISTYYSLCTYTPLEEVESIRQQVEGGSENPKDLKMKLAHDIVAIYYGEERATNAEDAFTKTFSKKEIPDKIPELKYGSGATLMDILVRDEKILSSNSELRRLVSNGGLRLVKDGSLVKITDEQYQPKKGDTVKVGKHKFFRLTQK